MDMPEVIDRGYGSIKYKNFCFIIGCFWSGPEENGFKGSPQSFLEPAEISWATTKFNLSRQFEIILMID